MTNAPEKPARHPRRRPAPSPRDQQIYLDYQTTGQRQIDLATHYRLTQCRISQIVRRVDAWRLQSATNSVPGSPLRPQHPEAPASSSESRTPSPESPSSDSAICNPHSAISPTEFDLQLQHRRLDSVCREALRHFHDPQKCVTHKKGTRADKSIDETTQRHLPPNLQCLKIILQATAQQTRLLSSRHTPCAVRTRPISPSPAPLRAPSPDSAIRTPQSVISTLSREHVEAWLTNHRTDAAHDHKVPPDPVPRVVAHDLVSALLGEPNQGLALRALAHESGKKIVQRKSYDDEPVPLPPQDGAYYAMYDAHGGLVGWLNADQVATVITPDYPPLSRDSAPPPADVDPVPHSALPTPHSARAPNPSLTANSSTSQPATHSPQTASPPPLTSLPPRPQFPAHPPLCFTLPVVQSTP